jgi:D-alanyl-lipoteichoic acid acyltransferase DltB (MBOAT superfamily)
MLFSSFEFIFLFLPFTFFVYFYLNKKKLVIASKGFLVFASLFFYSWWNVAYLPIILSSMLFNYVLGNSLVKEKKKAVSNKILLIIGITVNLSLLAYFKYVDFFLENFNLMTSSQVELLNLALPLAISFFTFQQIAYLVDSYRAETKEYDFLNYALFVTFFPQLIAGPIVHHKEMMPQFGRLKNKYINYRNIALGLFIFSIGLFKKIVIADSFAVFVNNGFDKAEVLTMIEAWGASLSYTFQLYFDFSGYVDMAIGAALLFNIRLPINFNSPYKAKDIQDFWRRWHITLSRFLRDYIYIPLGGNRKGSFRTYNNLMITFLLGGLWHGAGWTFIFWGFLHGAALSIHRVWQSLGFKLYTWLAWFITFNFVNIAWVFFRAKEWDDAIKVLKGMFGLSGFVPFNVNEFLALNPHAIKAISLFDSVTKSDLIIYLVICIGTLFIIHRKNSIEMIQEFNPTLRNLLFMVVLFLVSFLFMNSIKLTEFLYFDF